MRHLKAIMLSCAILGFAMSMNSCWDSGSKEEVVNPYAREYRTRLVSMNSLPDSDLVLTALISSHMLSARSWMLIYPSSQAIDPIDLPEDLADQPDLVGPQGPTSMQIIDPNGVVEIDGKKLRMEPGRAAILNSDGTVTLLRHPANLYISWFTYYESLIQDKREPSENLGPVWTEELKQMFEAAQ